MIERWARSLSGLGNGWPGLRAIYGALGRRASCCQDFLNGSWLGHPLHPVLVDVVIGGAHHAVRAGPPELAPRR